MAEAVARLVNYPTSPRKMRYVADMIRGVDANKALDILQHSTKHGAKPMYKLLLSAIDNWVKKNEGLRIEDAHLIVKTVYVDGGTILKRWLNAPHGRAFKMRKRSNHITIAVDSKALPVDGTVNSKQEAAGTESNSGDSFEGKVAKKPARKRNSKKEKVSA